MREPNIDRSGSDMRKVVLAADAEVGMCEALCVAIDGCLSFTYVKQSSSVPKPVCRLKDARPFGHESACCVSGVRATP